LREALAAADHDFVLSEPASKLKCLGETLLTVRRRGFSRTARQGRRYLNILATGLFVAAATTILLNALVWQRTRHPAPLSARTAPAVSAKEPTIAEMIAVPAPRPQPAVTALQAHDKPSEKPPAQKPLIEKPPLEMAAGVHPRPHDKISQLLKAPPSPKASAAPRARSTPADTAPAAPSKSVLAAQRALVKLGFVLNPDGVAGQTTRRALERYERDRGLPVHGDLTPALMRRLVSDAGITGDR
jgi:Putative peptidoglycan binding domain